MRIDVGQKMAEKRKYKTGKSRNRTLEREDRETERLLEKRPVCDICSVFLNVGVHSLCEQIRKDKSFSNLLESQKAFRKGFKNVDDRRLQDCKEDPFITYGLRKTHYTKRTRIVCDVCQVELKPEFLIFSPQLNATSTLDPSMGIPNLEVTQIYLFI